MNIFYNSQNGLVRKICVGEKDLIEYEHREGIEEEIIFLGRTDATIPLIVVEDDGKSASLNFDEKNLVYNKDYVIWGFAVEYRINDKLYKNPISKILPVPEEMRESIYDILINDMDYYGSRLFFVNNHV